MIDEESGEGAPTEIFDAVPAAVACFAQTLVERRTLVQTLDVPRIDGQSSVDDLRRENAFVPLADVPGYGDWLNWVVVWTSYFSRVSDAVTLRLRLSHSRHATCPRFHTDAIRVRLIATLVGPGTEWLRPEHVQRDTDGNIAQTSDLNKLEKMAPGSIGIFKGTSFDPLSCRGVVHRSPQERTDRVVMTLDTAA